MPLDRAAAAGGGGGGGGGRDATAGPLSGISILSTRTAPSLQAHAVGAVSTAELGALQGVDFASTLDGGRGGGGGVASGGVGTGVGGVLLSAGWQHGRISLVPLFF